MIYLYTEQWNIEPQYARVDHWLLGREAVNTVRYSEPDIAASGNIFFGWTTKKSAGHTGKMADAANEEVAEMFVQFQHNCDQMVFWINFKVSTRLLCSSNWLSNR